MAEDIFPAHWSSPINGSYFWVTALFVPGCSVKGLRPDLLEETHNRVEELLIRSIMAVCVASQSPSSVSSAFKKRENRF
jgi:hypothetical protein